MTPERIRELLGDEAMRVLVEKLDRRLAKNLEIKGHVILRDPSPETREAVTSLLGMPPKPSGVLRVDLSRLDAAIRDSGAADGLITALTMLLGRPPQHPAMERKKAREQWISAWTVPDTDALSERVLQYLQQICADGVLRRVTAGSIEAAHRTLRSITRCLTALPCDEPTPLPIFANRLLGDSHALDADQPLSSLLLQAIAKTNGLGSSNSQPRDIWYSVNVVQDELSSTVLVLNFPARDEGLLGRMLASHAAVGEPCRLTFAQLRRHPVGLSPDAHDVFICENPSILAAAAEQLKNRSQPLICVEGQPSHTAAKLMAICRDAGKRLHYHGDIDRRGLQIAAQIIKRFEAEPWRLSADDYERHADRSDLPWKGRIPHTHWDASLSQAIASRQKVILEETVAHGLLADLGK